MPALALRFDRDTSRHPLSNEFQLLLLMRVQYGEHFCPTVVSCKSAPREHFEKLVNVNHTPLPVVTSLNALWETLMKSQDDWLDNQTLWHLLVNQEYPIPSHPPP